MVTFTPAPSLEGEHPERKRTQIVDLHDTPDIFVVTLAGVLPVRAEASRRAEMISQTLCGEVAHVLAEHGDWYLIEMADGLQGWLAGGGTRAVSFQEADAWRRSASSVSLGTPVADVSGRQAATPIFVPWGARLRPAADGRVEFPDGATGRPSRSELVVSHDVLFERFPAHGAAVVKTALLWLGTPYLWGGRTEAGADCSGFVQSVFRLHGIELPRDSAPQAACGKEIHIGPGEAPDLLAGDLLFFGSTDDAEQIGHVGISLGGSRMIHCAAGNGGTAINDVGGDGEYERRLGSLLATARRAAEIG